MGPELTEEEDTVEVKEDTTNLVDTRPMKNGKFSIQDYAITFVYGMGKSQRERFKQMLEQGIKCGESVAISYGVDYDQLINEVKRILNVEE